MIYVLYSIVLYGVLVAIGSISVVCMYSTMKTFIEIEHYFFTSGILLIHILTMVFTLVGELLLIFGLSLLNAAFFRITDEDKFLLPTVEVGRE